MKQIKIENLKAGMVTGQTVCSKSGQILMVSGTRLSNSMILRLQEMDLVSLLIDEAEEVLYQVTEHSLAQTYKEASTQFKHTLDSVFENNHINIAAIRANVEGLINEFLKNRSILTAIYIIRKCNDYAVHHSIQVCIMSLVIGIKLEYSHEQLMELGMGALLQDIGMARVDPEVISKTGSLSSEEYDEIQQHSTVGHEIIQRYEEISLHAANVILQHHERWNGSGYPQGLKTKEIHEYARIVAVADVFSALTSDRPYRPAYTFDEAVEYITTLSDYYFDPKIVDAFLDSIISYPVDSIVILNSGAFALVVDVHPQVPTLPTVRIICDSSLKMAVADKEINLYKTRDFKVAQVLNQKQTALFLSKTKSISG